MQPSSKSGRRGYQDKTLIEMFPACLRSPKRQIAHRIIEAQQEASQFGILQDILESTQSGLVMT